MSMTTPIGVSFTPYNINDASHTFEFLYHSGSEVKGNTLTIHRNSDGVEVYNKTIMATDVGRAEALQYKHTVYANDIASTMQNGVQYNFTFIAIGNSEESLPSSPTLFWCNSKPILSITNIPSSELIESSTYSFNGRYVQNDNELMELAIFRIYDSSGSEIANSGNIYNKNATPSPFTFSYTFSGLLSSKEYSIEVYSVGKHGSVANSVKYPFHVGYVVPEAFSLVEVSNSCDGGYVQIDNNMKIIEGITYIKPPIYIGGTKIDLTRIKGSTNTMDYCTWDNGLTIGNNFTARFWFENASNESLFGNGYNNIIKMYNTQMSISVYLFQDYEYGTNTIKTYAGLTQTMLNNPIYLDPKLQYYDIKNYSNGVDYIEGTTKLFVAIRKINNTFTVELEVL